MEQGKEAKRSAAEEIFEGGKGRLREQTRQRNAEGPREPAADGSFVFDER